MPHQDRVTGGNLFFRRVRTLAAGASIALLLSRQVAMAAPLDPNASIFNSSVTANGALNITSGQLIIDTDSGQMTNAATRQGVIFNQGGTFNPTIAVFDFTSLNIGPNVTVSVVGQRPLAILSRGALTLSTDINISGVTGSASGGNGGGASGGAANASGAGPGGGSVESFFISLSGGRGAGFGGNGGKGYLNSSAPAGATYGDLLSSLQAGSGGAGSKTSGGSGAGAIALCAVGALTLSGDVLANGGVGGGNANRGGGGRQGGGGPSP